MNVSTTNIGFTTVAPSATAASGVIQTQGNKSGSVGLQSDHAGTLSVQRYVDVGGTVPLGTAPNVPVVANTPISVGWADGLPCNAIIVTFINGAGAVANLSKISVLLTP